MSKIPRDTLPDCTLALLGDPYRFISKRCARHGSDLFRTRFLLQRAVCLRGREAAELFYDTSRFQRQGAVPRRIVKTIFGQGGVQVLDDAAHRHRKAMFMDLMTPERIAQFADATAEQLRASACRWRSMDEVVLYDELHGPLGRAVCGWAGVPLTESEADRRIGDLTALFDGAGAIGPRHWRARLARGRCNRWCVGVIEDVRAGRLRPAESTAAHVIARHRDLSGNLLDPHTAAVELVNVLRPVVAVSVFIVLTAHALHEHPEWRRRLASAAGDDRELFVQEVRRFYPFFPFVGALVRHDFEWRGYHFPKGMLALLDLYGTDHDPHTWERPETFDPERFRHWNGDAFNFIPQGGADHRTNHRCAGEWITIELMKRAVDFLTKEIAYDVPPQDLCIDFTRLPALPQSRFVIRNVRGES